MLQRTCVLNYTLELKLISTSHDKTVSYTNSLSHEAVQLPSRQRNATYVRTCVRYIAIKAIIDSRGQLCEEADARCNICGVVKDTDHLLRMRETRRKASTAQISQSH